MISSIPKWVSNLFGSTMRPNVKVVATHYISPQVKQIRFQGNISKWNFQIGYANVIRVSETAFRNYTIAYHDRENGLFDIIFHIHGKEIGSQFIDNLKENDELFISPPRGMKLYNKSIKQQLFFGDETSFGVACALLPLLKNNNHQFHFYFEIDQINENVPELLELENYTLFPKYSSFRKEEWVSNLPLFKTDDWNTANVTLVGNVISVQTLRKVLKHKTKGNIYSQGYWLEGKKGL